MIRAMIIAICIVAIASPAWGAIPTWQLVMGSVAAGVLGGMFRGPDA